MFGLIMRHRQLSHSGVPGGQLAVRKGFQVGAVSQPRQVLYEELDGLFCHQAGKGMRLGGTRCVDGMIQPANAGRKQQRQRRARQQIRIIDNALGRPVDSQEPGLEVGLFVDRRTDRRPFRGGKRRWYRNLPDTGRSARGGNHFRSIGRQLHLQPEQAFAVKDLLGDAELHGLNHAHNRPATHRHDHVGIKRIRFNRSGQDVGKW